MLELDKLIQKHGFSGLDDMKESVIGSLLTLEPKFSDVKLREIHPFKLVAMLTQLIAENDDNE